MIKSLRNFLVFAYLWLIGSSVFAQAVWLSDGARLYAIDTLANQAVPVAGEMPITALATSANGGAWVLSGTHLFAFDSNGGVASPPVDLVAFGVNDAMLLAVDPHNAALWVATPSGRLVSANAQGVPIGFYDLPGPPHALAVAQDQSLWVLGDTELWNYASGGERVHTIALGPNVHEPLSHLAVDSIGGVLWAAGATQLVRVGLSGVAAPQWVEMPRPIRDLALEPQTGMLWVLLEDVLAGYTAKGERRPYIDLAALGLREVVALATDPTDGTLWLGHATGVSRMSPRGTLLANPELKAPVSRVAATPFWMTPRLSLLDPVPGFTTANPQPTFKLGLDALCSGAPCSLPSALADTFSLSASLDAEDVSKSLVRGPEPGQATFTPAQPLTAGRHSFSAVAVDTFGHASNRLDVDFTIGTSPTAITSVSKEGKDQPPTVSLTAPADGARFTTGTPVTLAATASDSDGTVQRVEFRVNGGRIASANKAPYTKTWTPKTAGHYVLTAWAVDNSGSSATSAPVNVTVVTNRPPTVRLTAPADGATFTAGLTITLSATASDPDGKIKKVQFFAGSSLLGTATTAPYTVTWTNVAAGSYTLVAKATDNSGTTASARAITITVNPESNALSTTGISSPATGAIVNALASATSTVSTTASDGTVSTLDTSSTTGLVSDAPASATIMANAADSDSTITASAADSETVTTSAADSNGTVGAMLLGAAASAQSSMNQSPLAVLTVPAACAQFQGAASITLYASALDPDGAIAWVEFYQNDTLIGTVTQPTPSYSQTYTLAWNNPPPGSYTLTAKATDDQGASTTSSPITIQVAAPNMPPTVSLTVPTDGATFAAGSTITLSATASDPDGSITKVEFYRGGSTLIGTATTAPYTFDWANVPAGSYTLTAKATDNSGAVTTSAGVTISIVAHTPPSVTLTAPANGTSFNAGANLTLSASASAAEGTLTQVAFYAGATLLGTTNQTPYTLPWNNVPGGSYTLTAKATDSFGATTTSSPVAITVNGPSATLTGPTDGASFTAPATIVIQSTASSATGTLSTLEFYDGMTLLGTFNVGVASTSVTFTYNDVAAGTHVLTVKATDNAGLSYTTTPVTVNVTAPPMVTLTAPAGGATFAAPATITLTADASVPGATITQVEFYQGDTLLGAVTTEPYRYTWGNVPAGSYILTAKATSSTGLMATSSPVTVTVAPLAVTITSPTAGATLTGTQVMVSGTLLAPPNSGVAVNGQVAAIEDNRFYALVPLSAGANTLTATLTTQAGATATASLTVTSDGLAPPIAITADTLEGIGMLPVTFTLVNGSALDATAVSNLWSGEVTLRAGQRITSAVTFPTGTWPVTISATDTDGHVTSQDFVVVVHDAVRMDAMLKNLYAGMLDDLKAQDVDGALTAVSGSRHDEYSAIFTALLPNIQTVVDQLGTLQAGTLGTAMAEYVLLREGVDGPHAFLLYLLRGEDGVWRIDGM